MRLENIPFDEINEGHLLDLITDKVSEGLTLDYKRELVGKKDPNKRDRDKQDPNREFACDVAAFANSSGGFLIFGMDEGKGAVATSLKGFTDDKDEVIQFLSNVSRDLIQPRLPIKIRAIPVQTGGNAFIVSIPRSLHQPHGVITGDGRFFFYRRGSHGKEPMDINQIRSAFLATDEDNKRFHQFRMERIRAIRDKETPLPYDPRFIVLHLLPYERLVPVGRFLQPRVDKEGHLLYYPLLNGQYRQDYPCFEGHVFRNDSAFTCLWRDGIVESAVIDGQISYEATPDNLPYHIDDHTSEYIKKRFIGFILQPSLEENVIAVVEEMAKVLKTIGVEPPIGIMLSLVGFAGYTIKPGIIDGLTQFRAISHNELLLPAVTLETFDFEADRVMKPIFDRIWNACGQVESTFYGQDGKFKGPQSSYSW